MASLPLVPLDDAVVFPGMPVTIPAISGNDRRVLLIPRRGVGYARVGVVAEVTKRHTIRGTDVMSLDALHPRRPRHRPWRPGRRAARRGGRAPRRRAAAGADRRPRARVPRRGRGDPRAARRRRPHQRLRPLDHGAGRAGRHGRLLARPEQRAEARAARDARHRAAPVAVAEVPARAAGRAAGAQAHPRGRRERRPEAAARLLPAQADGRDPQGTGRERSLGHRGLPQEDRRGGHARRGARAGRARAVAVRAPGRPERRVVGDPHLSRLAAGRPLVEAIRGRHRSAEGAGGARRRPLGSRRRQDAHHRVPGRAQAAQGSRPHRRQALGRDPDARRPSGHGQDLDWRVDRQGDRPQVRAHVARRRPRRIRDPRPPAHLHRRAAGAAGPRPARRRHDEPGDPARRGRQAGTRLARRSVVGAARGARSGAEPQLPGSLPGRAARPVARDVHRHRQRGRQHPGPAARPDGSDPLRRLHDRREGPHRPRLSLAAAGGTQRPGAGGRHHRGRAAAPHRRRLHARGGRPAARTRAGQGAAQDRDAGRHWATSRSRSSSIRRR